MGGYYRLGPYDARKLGEMIGRLSTDRNRVPRATMALFCWSQMQARGVPCPHFRCGVRTIAKECETTPRAAQKFVERAESEGWVVQLGRETNRGGSFVRRTFSWVAAEAAEQAGMDLDEWLREQGGVTATGYRGVTQGGYRGGVNSQQNRLQGCNPTTTKPQEPTAVLEGRVTHQSTEYSEGGAPRPSSEVGTVAPSAGSVDATPTPMPEGWS